MDIDLTCPDCQGERVVAHVSWADNADVDEVPCPYCTDGRRLPTLDEWDKLKIERDQLCLSVDVLANLIREEYPKNYTLAEIAETWGHCITPEQLAALAALE